MVVTCTNTEYFENEIRNYTKILMENKKLSKLFMENYLFFFTDKALHCVLFSVFSKVKPTCDISMSLNIQWILSKSPTDIQHTGRMATFPHLTQNVPCPILQSRRADIVSCVMRKPEFCLSENKVADQLCSNCKADQRRFHYTDSTIPLLPKLEISSI